ncbi:MAG: hypothetical protein WCA35_16585 [Kovacikia sp.]
MQIPLIDADSGLPRILGWADLIGDVFGLNVPQIFEVEQLKQLPAGTLGRGLADFLEQQQLTPIVTGPRRKQLHDSVHVLTGYDTDPIGEAEVQAFLLGAKFHPLQIILGLGIGYILSREGFSPAVRQRLWQAYRRGWNATFDVDSWQPEQQWQLSLVQVREFYHV